MKVTTIGAALVDIYFESPDFQVRDKAGDQFLCQPYGHKVEIIDHEVTTGGSATNTAVAFARRGHDVSIIAELGHDNFASMIKNELIAEKVNTQYLIQEKQEKTGCSVILRGGDGGRTVMVSRSASGMLDDYDIPVPYLTTRDWIHLGSVGGNLNALSEIWQVFELAKVGFSWNPGMSELKHLTSGNLELPSVTKGVFIVNEQEWQVIEKLQKKILTSFTWVIITAGKKGGNIYVGGEHYREFAAKSDMPAFEETGAGDAFASGLVSTIIYERTIDEALQAALNNSDSVIRHIGAKKGLLSF